MTITSPFHAQSTAASVSRLSALCAGPGAGRAALDPFARPGWPHLLMTVINDGLPTKKGLILHGLTSTRETRAGTWGQ